MHPPTPTPYPPTVTVAKIISLMVLVALQKETKNPNLPLNRTHTMPVCRKPVINFNCPYVHGLSSDTEDHASSGPWVKVTDRL